MIRAELTLMLERLRDAHVQMLNACDDLYEVPRRANALLEITQQTAGTMHDAADELERLHRLPGGLLSDDPLPRPERKAA